MKNLIAFLKKQKLLVIACHDAKNVWVANVYFVIDAKGTIYFVSSKNTMHSKMILKNPNIAFSVAWFNPKKHTDRKGIQGRGVCREAKNAKEIILGLTLFAQSFPDLGKKITPKWIHKNAWETKVWILKPTYIKYWNDELFGDEGNREFT